MRVRRAFGPTVLVGGGAGAATAWAAHREWARLAGGGSASSELIAGSAGDAPLAAALSLVSLALWGVLLLTRGRVRKAAAWLALVAAGSVVAACVAALRAGPDAVADQAATHGGTGDLEVALTPWGWVTLAGAVLVTAASLVAVRTVGIWPEMSGRYDAPQASGADQPSDPHDIWKALDEGRDPTAGP